MNITCPSCGCRGSLELFTADREWREAIMMAAALPSNCGALALRYVGLFRPMQRQLTPARSGALIREVVELITADSTLYNRAITKVPAYVWHRALNTVLDKPDLQRPLKNHNLLKSIAINLATQPDRDSYTEENESEQRNSSTGTSLKSVGSIIDKSAKADADAEKLLQKMTPAKRAALADQAKTKLLAEGISESLIITPMIDGMMLSILKENV